MTRSGEAGMTLLEVLVAMAIFALVSAAAYTALQQGLAIQERLGETRELWRRLDSVMRLLANDLDQARDLAPRAPARARSLAFQGQGEGGTARDGRRIRFTRGGRTSFRDGPVSPFLRVGYRLREGVLYRVTWPRLDAPAASEPRETPMLEGISEMRLRFLRADQGWVSRWPPRTPAESGGEGEQRPGLPAAVEVSLTLEGHGTFRRLLHVGPPD